MLDRCKITLPHLELDPHALMDPNRFADEHGFPMLNISSSFVKPRQGANVRISPLVDGALLIMARKEGSHLLAFLLEFNPGKLLFGHNGIPISCADSLCEGLEEAAEIMLPFLKNKSDLSRLIPSDEQNNGGHWSMLEICLNLSDPDGTLQAAFVNASHPFIQKPAFDVSGQSRKLVGSLLSVSFYRKDIEMRKIIKKFKGATETPRIFRVEYRLKGSKLPQLFGLKDQKLRAFRIDDLIQVHRNISSQIAGVFSSDSIPVSTNERPGNKHSVTNNAKFIHHLIRCGKGHSDELIRDYANVTNCKASTISRLRTGVRCLLESSSDLRMEDVFSHDAYFDQPIINVPALEEVTRNMRRSRSTSPTIRSSYGYGVDRNFQPHSVIYNVI